MSISIKLKTKAAGAKIFSKREIWQRSHSEDRLQKWQNVFLAVSISFPLPILQMLFKSPQNPSIVFIPEINHKKMPQSLVANSEILLISSGMILLHCQSLIRDTKEISPEILKLDVSQLSLELISF